MEDRQISEGVVWQQEALSRERRFELLGQRGATVWFTGLPASGKSTVAASLVVRLVDAGIPAYRLGGGEPGRGPCGGFGLRAGRRRGQPAPRLVRRSRLLRGQPRGERPPRRGGRAADGGRRDDRRGLARLALRG